MTKRAIQSAILAVVFLVSILFSSPQPAGADPSPRVWKLSDYVGTIHIKAKFIFQENNVVEYDFMETRGLIGLTFSSSIKEAFISFNPWSIQEADISEGAFGATMFATGTSADARSTGFTPDSSDFDYFTIPFSVKNVAATSHSCWESIPGDPCGKIGWDMTEELIKSHASLLSVIKLLIYTNSSDILGGSCSLPGWDSDPYHDTIFSEDCYWHVHKIVAKDTKPEWTKKK